MMVKQTRIYFDVRDVLQVRLVCGYRDPEDETPCDGEFLYQFGKRRVDIDWHCPKCGDEWKTTFPRNMPPEMREVTAQEAASFNLLNALETLLGPGCAAFHIRFEIDGEETAK